MRRAAHERHRVERSEMRRFTGATQRRRRVAAFSVGLVVVLAGGVAAAAYSPLFAVRDIEVSGTSRLDAAAVARALHAQVGTPLPLVDQAAVRRELSSFDLIASYTTESRPPGTLVVDVVERTPIALVRSSSGYRLVDAAGVTIATSADRTAGYPVVAETTGSKEFRAVVDVLAAVPSSLLSRIDRATADTADDVTFRLTSGQQVVWGGPERGSLKAADLQALLQSGVRAATYDVSSPEAPVTR